MKTDLFSFRHSGKCRNPVTSASLWIIRYAHPSGRPWAFNALRAYVPAFAGMTLMSF
jgi:hypothetical protein